MKDRNLPTIKDLELGTIAAEMYSEQRAEIMRNIPTENFSVKIARALKQFRLENKRAARAAQFADWTVYFAKR